MNAETRGKIDQGIANVVAVTHISELKAAERTELFFESKEIGERLARVKLIRESVNSRNVGIGGHLFENALVINARDNPLHPAVEIASHVCDGLARAE